MMTAMNTSSRHIASVTPAIIGFGRRCPTASAPGAAMRRGMTARPAYDEQRRPPQRARTHDDEWQSDHAQGRRIHDRWRHPTAGEP
mgnify:CR=1 FL=1